MADQVSPPIPPQNQPSNTPPPQPVAYDTNGNPLYAAPPQTDAAAAPQVVHLSRAISPEAQEITPEMQLKHDRSTAEYPHLNLSKAEYILSAVRRHPIGLTIPVGLTAVLLTLVALILFNYDIIAESLGFFDAPSYGIVLMIGLLFGTLVLLGGYIAIWVYVNNRFFLTNESVIQELQMSLFTRKEQTVSLANIEDASYDQKGIIQMLFNYGSIRLSTEGDETTYRFSYVANPKEQIAILNNAVEAFKNGRPVEQS
ncbi:MAG TPA: PH domain-containing protein [Candidatus Saccharimonadales bacterium]